MAAPEIAAPAHTAQMKIWLALGGKSSGIVGNKAHTYGFHRGAAYVPGTDYSRARDPQGSDGPYPNWGWCCAGDYWHGGLAVLRARHAVLLTRLMDGDPELATVCEYIGQPWAGKPVYYWAVWNGRRTLQRYTGSGHDTWSHISVWRSRADMPPNLWTPGGQGGGTPVKEAGKVVVTVPAWPKGATFWRASRTPKYHATVRAWQARMKQRGWSIKVDGYYGLASAKIAEAFQRQQGLVVDGLLGPRTFRAAWSAPVK